MTGGSAGGPVSDSARGSSDGSACGLVPIYDPVLCYVANVRNSSRRSDISHLVATYFSLQAIDNAKKCVVG